MQVSKNTILWHVDEKKYSDTIISSVFWFLWTVLMSVMVWISGSQAVGRGQVGGRGCGRDRFKNHWSLNHFWLAFQLTPGDSSAANWVTSDKNGQISSREQNNAKTWIFTADAEKNEWGWAANTPAAHTRRGRFNTRSYHWSVISAVTSEITSCS